jgi:uncharacterized protein
MLNWFQKLMPREERFFTLFDRHAACLKAGAHTLRELLNGGPRVPELCARLVQQEHEADLVAHEVLLAIRRTFITPFDRSDIKGLITSMDDAIDQMNKTAKTIMLYDVTAFEDHMREIGDVIVKAADLTVEIVPLLNAMGDNATRLNSMTEQVAKLEELSDQLHDTGLKALYLGKGKADAMAFIIGSEIYDHLEKTADRFEDVASQVNGILIEHL